MPFIGIIAKENDSNFIKNEIIKNAKINKFDILNINTKSIENIKNVKFDIIAINENVNCFLKNSKYLENIISNAKYTIINSDIKNNLILLNNIGTNVITYGFNEKASITLSSIKDENTLFCIQRAIKDVNNNLIDLQDVSVQISKNNINKTYNSFTIFTILQIYGEKLKKI